jgi:hypothetical protein
MSALVEWEWRFPTKYASLGRCHLYPAHIPMTRRHPPLCGHARLSRTTVARPEHIRCERCKDSLRGWLKRLTK